MRKYTVHYQIAEKRIRTTLKAMSGKQASLIVQNSLKFTDVKEHDKLHLFRKLEKTSGVKIIP